MDCYYELDVCYAFTPEWHAIDLQLVKALGYSESSGAGMGIRDCQWHYKSRVGADDAERKVVVILGPRGSGGQLPTYDIHHIHWDDEWVSKPQAELAVLMHPETDCIVQKEDRT